MSFTLIATTLQGLGRVSSWTEAFDGIAYRLSCEGKLDVVSILTSDEYRGAYFGISSHGFMYLSDMPCYKKKGDEIKALQFLKETGLSEHGEKVSIVLEHGRAIDVKRDPGRHVWMLTVIYSHSNESGIKKQMNTQLLSS